MDFLLRIIFVILIIKAFIVFLLLAGAVMLWISGVDNILFPGLGLVISVPFIIILLLMAEVFLVAILAFLRRYISKIRLQ